MSWPMFRFRSQGNGERLVKIGPRIARHGRSINFQMAEVVVPRDLFKQILGAIEPLRSLPPVRC